MREEIFVSTLQDVEFGVVEFGILVHGAVPLPDEATHARAALRRELAVEDDDDSLVWASWDDGGLEEVILHLVFLMEVQSSLRWQISDISDCQRSSSGPRHPCWQLLTHLDVSSIKLVGVAAVDDDDLLD